MKTVQPTKLTGVEMREFADRFLKEVKTNLTRWKIDAAWINGEVTLTVEEFDVAFDADSDPTTKNQQTTMRKNAARKKLDGVLHTLIELLRGDVYVTDDDERMLGIYLEPHDNHPTPTTTKSPVTHVELNHIRRVSGYFTPEGEEGGGKPDGVSAVQMAHGFAVDGKIPTIKELIHQNLDLYSRNSFMIEFDDEERGQKLYMAARYVMRATSSGYGPWSEICFAIIP
jgi:hypothetical protein